MLAERTEWGQGDSGHLGTDARSAASPEERARRDRGGNHRHAPTRGEGGKTRPPLTLQPVMLEPYWVRIRLAAANAAAPAFVRDSDPGP